MLTFQVSKFSRVVGALGSDTLSAIATSGPEMQVRLPLMMERDADMWTPSCFYCNVVAGETVEESWFEEHCLHRWKESYQPTEHISWSCWRSVEIKRIVKSYD